MDNVTEVLLVGLGVLIVASLGFTYYRSFVSHDFEVYYEEEYVEEYVPTEAEMDESALMEDAALAPESALDSPMEPVVTEQAADESPLEPAY